MKIAVNARMLLPHLEGVGHYINELIHRMAVQKPEYEFHLIFDRPFLSSYITSPNVKGHILRPQARHPLLWKYWFDYGLPRMLKRIQPDIFFSPEGYMSRRISLPSIMTIHDLAYLDFPDGSKTSHLNYLQKYMPQFVSDVDRIICVSDFTRDRLSHWFPEAAQKAHTIYNGVSNEFCPISTSGRRAILQEFTGGKPYFLYLGSIHPRKNIIRLVRAFEQFKEETESDVRLVLAGRFAWKAHDIRSQIKNSYYQKDIIHLDRVGSERSSLMASALACCYPSLYEGFGLPVIEAMACQTVVLTSKASAMEEICQRAALYFDPYSVEDMARQLKYVYQNRQMKEDLIAKGTERVEQFSWDLSASKTLGLFHDLQVNCAGIQND